QTIPGKDGVLILREDGQVQASAGFPNLLRTVQSIPQARFVGREPASGRMLIGLARGDVVEGPKVWPLLSPRASRVAFPLGRASLSIWAEPGGLRNARLAEDTGEREEIRATPNGFLKLSGPPLSFRADGLTLVASPETGQVSLEKLEGNGPR